MAERWERRDAIDRSISEIGEARKEKRERGLAFSVIPSPPSRELSRRAPDFPRLGFPLDIPRDDSNEISLLVYVPVWARGVVRSRTARSRGRTVGVETIRGPVPETSWLSPFATVDWLPVTDDELYPSKCQRARARHAGAWTFQISNARAATPPRSIDRREEARRSAASGGASSFCPRTRLSVYLSQQTACKKVPGERTGGNLFK